MLHVFDRAELEKKLRTLPQWKQAAFALAACERLFPLFVTFSRSTSWGDPDVLRRALDLAWDSLSRNGHPNQLQRAASEAEAQAPDTEDFSSEYTSAALDAALSTGNLMRLLERFEPNLVLEIAQAAFDTAYLLASVNPCASVVTPAGHQEILTTPIVQDELAAQTSDIELLASLQGDFEGNSAGLRAQWKSYSEGRLGSPEG